MREFALFMAAALGAVLLMQLLTLQGILGDAATPLPIDDLGTWLVATANALGGTALKQLLVFVLLKLGKVITPKARPAPPIP